MDCGVIRTDISQGHPSRLREIFESLSALVRLHRPGEAAVENVFHAANARSALLLGQARGAALVALSAHGVPVFEYMPLDVKKTVTGYGRAGKEQVRRMAVLLVQDAGALGRPRASFDASDAVAVALCHAARRRTAALAAGAFIARRRPS
jgi:crossover junction endodeoxyribonuclease RuvC